jgi:hypothetical protein
MTGEQEELNLKDVTEDANLPPESAKRSGRKKRLVMIGGLVVLLILVAIGGYTLLGERQLQVKASRKHAEKITSGADLQKAAYDSLKGSLDSSATSGQSAANIGEGQTTAIAMAGVTPSPAPANEQSATLKPLAPAQSGIAMTIAPPPDAATGNQDGRGQRAFEAGSERNQPENKNGFNTTLAAPASKPKVGSSISFAPLPVAVKNRTETPAAQTVLAKASEKPPGKDGAEKPELIRARAKTTPGFGAMLPVRLMGALYTLRPGSMARLELARDIKSGNWSLKRGTVFVGAVLGSELDRAFVQIKGFIDPDNQSFTKLEGELLGSDGGAGLRGKRRRVSSAWIKVLDRVAQSGAQILTSILGRRNGSVVVTTDPYGAYRSASGVDQSQIQDNRAFVEVPAGEVGFVLVTTLPEANKSDSHLAGADRLKDEERQIALPDSELAELLAEANPEQIRAALPRMNPELRRVAEMVLKEIEDERK